MAVVPVRVKICGVTTPEDAAAAVRAGADYLGVNFYSRSPRCVSVAQAREIVAVAGGVPLVGVFVNHPRHDVTTALRDVPLQLLQFHGDERPEDCAGWPLPVIRAIRPTPDDDPATLAAAYATDYILLDSYVAGQAGGTGVPIDPARARGLDARRLFLAGGLRPETVSDAVRAIRPFAVDVASGVERAPGRKDHGKLEAFIRSAKSV